MPADDQMTLPERLKYLRLIQPRYRAASRAKRSAMLTEAERLTRLHRKSLVRRLGWDLQPRPRRTWILRSASTSAVAWGAGGSARRYLEGWLRNSRSIIYDTKMIVCDYCHDKVYVTDAIG